MSDETTAPADDPKDPIAEYLAQLPTEPETMAATEPAAEPPSEMPAPEEGPTAEELDEQEREREAAEAAEIAARLTAGNAVKPGDNEEPTRINVQTSPLLQQELAAAGFGDVGIYIAGDHVTVPYGLSTERFRGILDVCNKHDAATARMKAARQEAFDTAMAYGNRLTAQVTKQYADVEVQSWTAQEAEAKAVMAGETLGDDALLPPMAANKGVDVKLYAQSVLDNAAAYRKIAVAAVILRRGADNLLSDTLDTPEKLDTAFQALKAQAVEFAGQLGITP